MVKQNLLIEVRSCDIRACSVFWVDNHLQKYRVVLAVGSSERRKWKKERTSRCHVHLSLRTLERRAGRVRTKRLDDVTRVGLVLIEKTERNLSLEWPCKERVKLAPHQDKEEGQMCSTANSIAVRIQASAHLVPARTREERLTVDGWGFTCGGLRLPTRQVTDFPDKNPVCRFQLLQILADIEITELLVMHPQ